MSKLAYELADAAALCGVSRDTLVKAINAGTLKAKAVTVTAQGKPSKRIVRHSDLESWLESLESA